MKKLISVILICALLLTLAACASSSGDDKFYRESDPIQVVDAGGRKVSSGAPIMTVATSWGGGVDAYIHALGVSDRLVATNSKHNLDRKFFNPDEMNKVGRWALDRGACQHLTGAVPPWCICNRANFGRKQSECSSVWNGIQFF